VELYPHSPIRSLPAVVVNQAEEKYNFFNQEIMKLHPPPPIYFHGVVTDWTQKT
jgi:hypothetical protein